MSDRDQLERVQERFTRTAREFAKFSLATRAAEAERLVALAAPRGDELALDLACGPGTFTWALARRVRFVHGLDLTAAMLEQARHAALREGIRNVAFEFGEATALPYPDSSIDLAACGYSIHHFSDPGGVLRELARVVRRGRPRGRLAVVDVIVPERADAELNNQIERARDASHVHTLRAAEMETLLEAAGFEVLVGEIGERRRSFDDWMRVAGWGPEDEPYAATRRLLDASVADDRAGFHPRVVKPGEKGSLPARQELEFVQTSLFIVAERR